MKGVLKLTSVLLLLLCNNGSFAQNYNDLGFLVYSTDLDRMNLVYRHALSDRYKLRFGYSQGGNYYPNLLSNTDIVVSTEDFVVELKSNLSNQQWGIMFGVDRKLKTSVFSVGADIKMNYRLAKRDQLNYGHILSSSGNWMPTEIEASDEDYFKVEFDKLSGPSGVASISQVFIVPEFRLNFGMNLPIGKEFLLSAMLTSGFGMPIYMGVKEKNDPDSVFTGIPPSIFEVNTSAVIGLRYLIGSKREKNQ